jgi:hypothetical protein
MEEIDIRSLKALAEMRAPLVSETLQRHFQLLFITAIGSMNFGWIFGVERKLTVVKATNKNVVSTMIKKHMCIQNVAV